MNAAPAGPDLPVGARSRLLVGSRRSALARHQARLVGDALSRAWSELSVEYVFLDTKGDRVRDRPVPEVGGKGIFTEALERALHAGEVDLAVHSLKDLPARSAPGLALLAVPEREDPCDVLLWRPGSSVEDLPAGAAVGTSSLRRRAQLLRARPDCRVVPMRGNVDTRLRKLDEGRCDALLLAAAGLERLGLVEKRMTRLDPVRWLPAPGQGALGLQGREEDEGTRTLLAPLADGAADSAVRAERAFLASLDGSCRVPIGALALHEGGRLTLRGAVYSPDGSDAVAGMGRGPVDRPERLGRSLAEDLLARGADRILATLRDGSA